LKMAPKAMEPKLIVRAEPKQASSRSLCYSMLRPLKQAIELFLTKERRDIDYVHLIKMFLFTPK
ncbi:unnamed protein product, partial [Ilex paraguariensis]